MLSNGGNQEDAANIIASLPSQSCDQWSDLGSHVQLASNGNDWGAAIRTTEKVVVTGLQAAFVNRSIDSLIIDTGKVTARLGDLINPTVARALEVLDWGLTLARGPIAVAMRLVSDQAGQIIGKAVQDRFERAGYGSDARYGAIGVSVAAAVVIGVGGGIYGAIRNATGRHISPPTNRFTRSEFTANSPSGTRQTYRVYQQQIDWSHVDNKGRTNLQRAQGGLAPLVLKNGVWEGLELHHSR
jgi:hypothetical protein